MQSLAWSTIALIVLLLPGFAFPLGQSANARFGRDLTPRNPLGALAITVGVALAVHATLTWLLSWAPAQFHVQWNEVIEAVQMPAPPATATTDPGNLDTAAERVGREAEQHTLSIFAYVALSGVLGYAIGYGAGWLERKQRLPFAEHSWAHRIKTAHKKNRTVVHYAHVLADVAHDGQQLLYRGRPLFFSLRSDGTFAYVILLATEQRLLNLVGNAPRPGPRRMIGGREAGTRRPQRHNRGTKTADSDALMFIAGANIKDLVFQGYYEVDDVARGGDLAEELKKGTQAAEKETAAIMNGLEAEKAIQLPLLTSKPWLSPVREAQWLLSVGGIYDGPIDGIAGALTRDAVLSFQRGYGLERDGIVGVATLQRLRDTYDDL